MTSQKDQHAEGNMTILHWSQSAETTRANVRSTCTSLHATSLTSPQAERSWKDWEGDEFPTVNVKGIESVLFEF